jgi:prepilin-type N-terminal cleavage/methylation domain-containing protein
MESKARSGRRAFTLVEIVVVLILMGITLVILYQIFYQMAFRQLAVQKRAEGQMAVRILLVRLRHELKRAIGVVHIANQNQLIRIPLEDRSKKSDDQSRYYFMEYEFRKERNSIMVRRMDRDPNNVVSEYLWLGGQNQIMRFKCYDTGENERILFQYYRVIIEVDHYEVKMRDTLAAKAVSEEERKKEYVHLTTTVYPRRVNMELRIEVPQEGGSGI